MASSSDVASSERVANSRRKSRQALVYSSNDGKIFSKILRRQCKVRELKRSPLEIVGSALTIVDTSPKVSGLATEYACMQLGAIEDDTMTV